MTRRHLGRGVLGGYAVIRRSQFVVTKRLAADAGSFAINGTPPTLLLARRIVAGGAAFAITGTDAALNKGKRLAAAGGSFALGGTAATLLMSRKIVAAAASYALTGTAATLTKAATVPTFTFVGSVAASGSSVDISGTGRQAGDFGVMLDYGRHASSPPGAVTPSGHTQAATISDNNTNSHSRASITYKILAGSESTLSGISAGAQNRKIYLVFRPNKSISTVTYVVGGAQATAGDPTGQTIDPSAEIAALIVGAMGSSGAISPRTTSPTMNEVAGADTLHFGHYLIYNSSPLSQSYDMDDEGNDNAMISGYFKFT